MFFLTIKLLFFLYFSEILNVHCFNLKLTAVEDINNNVAVNSYTNYLSSLLTRNKRQAPPAGQPGQPGNNPPSPATGQNPPANGQNPPANGQNPPANGQNPPANNGQNPPTDNSQNPNPPAQQQPQPDQPPPEAPPTISQNLPGDAVNGQPNNNNGGPKGSPFSNRHPSAFGLTPAEAGNTFGGKLCIPALWNKCRFIKFNCPHRGETIFCMKSGKMIYKCHLDCMHNHCGFGNDRINTAKFKNPMSKIKHIGRCRRNEEF